MIIRPSPSKERGGGARETILPEKIKEPVDLLIHGGLVVAMDDDFHTYPDGAVAVRGREIAAVGPSAKVQAQVEPQTTYDARGQVVMPGLINAHTHAAMTLFRGIADDLALEAWLARIWPLEIQYANAENVTAGAELAFAEMILAGTTAAADMYWQRDATTEAAIRAGFRLVNGSSFIDFTGPDGILPEERLSGAREFFERYRGHDLITPCIQAHATYTASRSALEQISKLAREYDALFITHAAESLTEVATVRERSGKTPIELLDELGLLGSRTLLAHCVHLSDAEISLLAERKTAVAHCPESNLKTGAGIARLPDMLKAGVIIGLGTDGAASNNDLDLWGEMRTAALIQKGVRNDPTVMDARSVVRMATLGGARALGLGERTGSLEPGKAADLITIGLNGLHQSPLYDIYSNLVYAAKSSDVRNVWIDGRQVLRERELLTIDAQRARARVNKIAHDLFGAW